MRILHSSVMALGLLAGVTAGHADTAVVDCSKKSLADAVVEATPKNAIITFTGICNGPVVVGMDGLTLQGVGTAIIDGAAADALTVVGSSRVSLVDFAVTNGLRGIVVRDGSHVSFMNVNAHHNALAGILIHAASSATLTNVTVTDNGTVGVGLDDGASASLKNSALTGNATLDLLMTFGSRLTGQNVAVGTWACDATVLVRGTTILTCPH